MSVLPSLPLLGSLRDFVSSLQHPLRIERTQASYHTCLSSNPRSDSYMPLGDLGSLTALREPPLIPALPSSFWEGPGEERASTGELDARGPAWHLARGRPPVNVTFFPHYL